MILKKYVGIIIMEKLIKVCVYVVEQNLLQRRIVIMVEAVKRITVGHALVEEMKMPKNK